MPEKLIRKRKRRAEARELDVGTKQEGAHQAIDKYDELMHPIGRNELGKLSFLKLLIKSNQVKSFSFHICIKANSFMIEFL